MLNLREATIRYRRGMVGERASAGDDSRTFPEAPITVSDANPKPPA